MKAPGITRTRRLVLRRPRREDAEAILARYAADPEVTRLVGWPRHRSLQDTLAFLEDSDDQWARWPAGPYLMASRRDGRLLGGTGFAFETPTRAMTGYVMARDAWGRGLATEALQAVVEMAPRIGVERLVAFCHPDNAASLRVLEKCGFRREALLADHTEYPNLAPGELREALRYGLDVSRRPPGSGRVL